MIVAIANQKGGVGKTTTAVTLAHGAAMAGKRTLLIDLDTQGNVADSLGVEEGGELVSWLLDKTPIKKAAKMVRDNLAIIRSDKNTAGLKMTLAGIAFRERILAERLGDYQEFDLVIMDCAPSVDVLHTAALVAADWLLVPTKLDQFAIKGVVEMNRSLSSIQRATPTNCRLAGIIPTFYDRVTRESHEQLDNLAGAFRSLVWAPVPQDTICRTANRQGKTIWEMGKGRAAEAYALILKRMLRLG